MHGRKGRLRAVLFPRCYPISCWTIWTVNWKSAGTASAVMPMTATFTLRANGQDRGSRQSITAFLGQRLQLKVNAAKSAVARPWERKFLGYSMTWHRKPKLKIAPESRQRLAEKIRLALRRGRGQSMQQVIKRLNPVLRGWMAYFQLTEVKNALEELDGWLRHKLRALLWRQWKRVYTRARNLMKAGIDKVQAWKSATNGRGPWWNGGASHMNRVFPKSWFDHMGLVSLVDTHRRFLSVS